MVDALDIENKWYTAYILNIDQKSGKVKIHYDDWADRFDEWIDPQSGKLAPYRTRAIGGRFQGGLPGRAALPIRPLNESVISNFIKMKSDFINQQQSIPDVTVHLLDNGKSQKMEKLKRFSEILEGTFYEMGIMWNDRAVYMNRHRIYIFYMGTYSVDEPVGEWCIGPKIGDKSRAILCQESTAANRLRPDLSTKTDLKPSSDSTADLMTSKTVEFESVIFEPAYFRKNYRKRSSSLKSIGQKGLDNIPKVTLNNRMNLPQIILGTAGLKSGVITEAAKMGYYMFDTGTQSMDKALYFNHQEIHDLFGIYGRATIGVSTKIPSNLHGYHSTIQNFISQLDTLGTDYIDLVLIEHPDCITKYGEAVECEGHWIDTWRALEYLYGVLTVCCAVLRMHFVS